MQECKRCVLPGTYPGISFDENGVCNFCNEYAVKEENETHLHFTSEEEVKECLKKYKNLGRKYDVLVPLSGGVDSCFTLIQIVNFVPGTPKELLGYQDRLPSLRVVISGGEKLDDSLKNQLLEKGYTLYNQYGPTETTIDALMKQCSLGEPVTLGSPIAMSDVTLWISK